MIESALRNSILLRMFIVGGLSLVLFIPAVFVEGIIAERQTRRDAVIKEISQSWGGGQMLTGPIVSIPFKRLSKDEKGNLSSFEQYAHFLPSKLNIRSSLKPEVRYRGIYEVALYNGDFVFEGEFPPFDFGQFGASPENILWRGACITFGISDLKGIRDPISLKWNALTHPSEPGVLTNDVVSSGVSFKPHLSALNRQSTFSLSVNLNGSSEILFVPVGEVTTVSMEAPWENPSFLGGFLPVERTIAPHQFRAEWKVLNLNRNFPQSWVGDQHKLQESSFGTRLFLPVDQYQKTSRTVKYALLFIVLTFAALFLSEVIAKTVLHPIQYGLIGLGLVLFYLLLLSLSEHLPFDVAYAASSLIVIALNTVYSRWITNGKVAAVMLTVLTALYSFLYVTLQLQDYSLLLGTFGLLLTLYVIMYLTRKIDWFSLNSFSRQETGHR